MDDARSRSTGVSTLRVRTSCDGTSALVERYARDVGSGGVFVRTREQFEVGAPVRFEYLLADGRCALAGEGRIAFRRPEGAGGAQSGSAAGVGIAIERLRRGDRPVVERMIAARAGVPSRFEQPQGVAGVVSTPPLRPDALFADVHIAGDDAPQAVAAYLSADLTADLPTVRPPASAAPALGRARTTSPSVGGDLADQLEPAPERSSALDPGEPDADATPLFVPLEERIPEQAVRSDRPSRPSSSNMLRAELVQAAVGRASDPEREQRFAALIANAAREKPPAARSSLVGVLLLLIVLALFGLAVTTGALDPWLQR